MNTQFGHILDQDSPQKKKKNGNNSNKESCGFASVHGNV